MFAVTLTGLFVAAFLAATPIPFQSEIVFLALQATGSHSLVSLVVVASVGNTLGSCLTYAAGRGLGGDRLLRLARLTPEQAERARAWFARWGVWSLLLSWAPAGDLIVLMSGVLRTPFMLFLALVAVAKTLRYIALAAGAAGVMQLIG